MARERPKLSTQTDSTKPLRFLGYGLPRADHDEVLRPRDLDGIELHNAPLGSGVSFLDYDGVVMFAGVYERPSNDAWLANDRRMTCIAPPDLHQREREFFTALERSKTFVFLTPHLPDTIGYHVVDPSCDLFRSIMSKLGVHWRCLQSPFPMVKSDVPEFRDYVSRYGMGYVCFGFSRDQHDWIRPLCYGGDHEYGLVLGGTVFLLPATIPQSHDQVIQMAKLALTAAVAYRARMSKALPPWVAEFTFSKEAELLARRDELRHQLAGLESGIETFATFKGALICRSDPLVAVVSDVIEQFFDMKLTIDEQCIEDATLRDEENQIVAVFEIKGVNGSFTRENVNQVDSHRDRLGLPSTIPGVLIMNTIMTAASLKEKDQAPHRDIIKKALANNVLLVRTLDLLRYADAVQRGSLTKDGFRATVLGGSGWLRVVDQVATIVKE